MDKETEDHRSSSPTVPTILDYRRLMSRGSMLGLTIVIYSRISEGRNVSRTACELG